MIQGVESEHLLSIYIIIERYGVQAGRYLEEAPSELECLVRELVVS